MDRSRGVKGPFVVRAKNASILVPQGMFVRHVDLKSRLNPSFTLLYRFLISYYGSHTVL